MGQEQLGFLLNQAIGTRFVDNFPAELLYRRLCWMDRSDFFLLDDGRPDCSCRYQLIRLVV